MRGLVGTGDRFKAALTVYASTFGFLPLLTLSVSVILGGADGVYMDLREVEELYQALSDAGFRMGFGSDCCTNIPTPYDPDDSGWHLLIREDVLEGRMDAFMRLLEERGLEWKHEEFLGRRNVSVYRPGYVFPGWVSNIVKR